MADLDRVKRNVAKMVQQNAPEEDIDSYLSGEGVTVDQVKAHKLGAAPASAAASHKAPDQPSVLVDMARSLPGGVAKGVAAIAGLPGDISNLMDRGADYLTGGNVSAHRVPGRIDSQQVNDIISAPTGGYYQPKTVPGSYAETIASFAPSALAPGSIASRAIRVLAPGIGSETGRQVGGDTGAVIGALAGGGVAGVADATMAAGRATPGILTTKQLKGAAQGQYQAADNAGLIINGDSFKNFGAGLKDTLANEGIDQTLHPRATAAYNRIAGTEGNVTLKGVDILRQIAGDTAASADKAERRLGYLIKNALDDYVGNLQPADVVQGEAQGASEAINTARDLWSRASKGEIIDNTMAKANRNKGMFTVAGDENAMRTAFRKLANNERAMRRFSPEEQQAITQVANGTPMGNVLRYLGKLAPRGVISGAPTYEAFQQGGPIAALATAGAGELGRFGASAITRNNAKYASELVRAGTPRSISNGANGAGYVAPQVQSQGVVPYAALISALAAQQAAGN
jgi:hypothetical protein